MINLNTILYLGVKICINILELKFSDGKAQEKYDGTKINGV